MTSSLSLAQRQAIARFVVGQSEQANPIPTVDFAGKVTYDPVTGNPTLFKPIGNSGYTVGSIQWDFGQRPGAVASFLQSFVGWTQGQGVDPFQYQTQDEIAAALSSKGSALSSNPSLGLNQNTIGLLNHFLASSTGSGWVNTNLVNPSIGVADGVYKNILFGGDYGYALTSAGLLVQNTVTGQLLSADDLAKVEAWGMKIANQGSPSEFAGFLSYLNSGSFGISQIRTYISNNYNKNINDGVTAVTAAYGAYSWIVTSRAMRGPPYRSPSARRRLRIFRS